MSQPESCEIVVVHHAQGINAGCVSCRQVIREGTWAVGLLVGGHRYLIGHNPPLTCCGQEKKVPQLFDSEDEAQVLVREVRAELQETGTTENLKLLEGFPLGSTEIH